MKWEDAKGVQIRRATKYLEQSKEIKQNWTGEENFDNCFCTILEGYYKIFVARRKTGHWALSLPNFDLFLTFPNFLRS